MNSLKVRFQVTISDDHTARITLTAGDHFRLCPSQLVLDEIFQLSARQIDLIRIGMAIHLADGLARRHQRMNGYRRPVVELDLLDSAFWEQAETAIKLKRCVDFLSGDDDWTFRPRKDTTFRHEQQRKLFRGDGPKPLVCAYSGGLDSAGGLAARLADVQGQEIVPVTVRYQSQRGRVIQEHFKYLRDRNVAHARQLRPFQVGAYSRNNRLKQEFGLRLREVTHRCKPFLFLSIAGLVACLEAVNVVEVYESGVGAVNLPLVSGGAGWQTTRSTHPEFLRLMDDLVSHVNEETMHYHLPFLDRTKAEMTGNLARMRLEELARLSVSCITHPLRRRGGRRQCGVCPACVFRRQALWHAGISEPEDAYLTDVFGGGLTDRQARTLMAFRQQVARLASLDGQQLPDFFRRHLRSTRAARSAAELAMFVDLFRRYRDEWIALEREVCLAQPASGRLVEVAGGNSP